MGLENASYIDQLVDTNPDGTDAKNQGDNHIRMIKAVLKNQFPNLGTEAIDATAAELNKLDGFTGTATDLNYAKDLRATGVTTTEFNKLDGLTSSTTELNYVDGVTSAIQTQINALNSDKAPYDTSNFTNNIWTSAGGFILNWGTGTSNSSGYEDVSFDSSIQNAEIVLVTDRGSSTSTVKTWAVASLTDNSFRAYVSGGGSNHTFYWLVVGRNS